MSNFLTLFGKKRIKNPRNHLSWHRGQPLNDINEQESHVDGRLSNDLTPEVRGDVGDMNPPSIALPNKLSKPNLPLLLHLLDELEQTTVVGSVTSDDVGSTSEHVMAVLHTPDERVEFLASISTADHDGLAPRFADGVKELLHQYVQQVVCSLRWAFVDALAQRGSAAC